MIFHKSHFHLLYAVCNTILCFNNAYYHPVSRFFDSFRYVYGSLTGFCLSSLNSPIAFIFPSFLPHFPHVLTLVYGHFLFLVCWFRPSFFSWSLDSWSLILAFLCYRIRSVSCPLHGKGRKLKETGCFVVLGSWFWFLSVRRIVILNTKVLTPKK